MTVSDFIKQEWLDDASIELEARLSAGEILPELYASYANEMIYLEKANQKESERYKYLQNMMFVVSDAMALEYIKHLGWQVNEHTRFVRAQDK